MCAITEPLKAPMAEVNNTASLLGVFRYPEEEEDTYRTRVAYAMMLHVRKCDGVSVSQRILDAVKNWEEKALDECYNAYMYGGTN